MSKHSDEEQIEEEQLNEKTDRRIFINQVDSYHGKNIARVSEFY
jgi:hypothetical protein